MVRLSIPAFLAYAATLVLATPQPIVPDPSGARNVGAGNGRQFITGGCKSTADCAQPACCAGIVGGDGSVGVCSGLAVGNVNGKTGCGFGDGAAAAAAATAPVKATTPAITDSTAGKGTAAGAPTVDAAATACNIDATQPGSQNVGKANASQFITGQCTSRADCASNCCTPKSSGIGECRAEVLSNQLGLSCDFTCAL